MPKLNLWMNTHHEGEALPDLMGRKDYLVYQEGSWYLCHWEDRFYGKGGWFQSPEGICFMEDDDFLWGELPEEVDDEN